MTPTVYSLPITAPEAQTAVQLAHAAAAEIDCLYTSAAYPEHGDSIVYTTTDGMVTSLCLWQVWCTRLCILQAWTMPNFRRQGLYGHLVARLITIARVTDLVGLIAFIAPLNHGSRVTHTALGFRNTYDMAWELLPKWGAE